MEHNRFKQRIVGGLVLVALGAIFIPFLLDMHQGDAWWGAGDIPKKPDNGFVTRVLPLDDWSKQAQGDMAAGTKQLDAVPPRTTTTAPPPVDTTTAKTPTPTADVSTAVDGGGAAEGWVVQLGSFSNQKNADELQQRLRNKPYHVYVESVAQDGQTVYRVRVGPQPQRADAEAIRDRLARELQLNGMVMHTP